jgi:hypothetical protein
VGRINAPRYLDSIDEKATQMISKLTEIAAALRGRLKNIGKAICSGGFEPDFRVLFSAVFHGVSLGDFHQGRNLWK